MKKGILKAAAGVLSLAMILGLCGCKKESTGGVAVLPTSETKITKEPTELTLFYIGSEGKKLEELEIWKEIAKRTNVSLKTISSINASDEATAFNTMMASGDLPDLIIYSDAKKVMPKYGKEGAFASLNDLIDTYAPNIKKLIDSNKEVKAHLTASDGQIYFISSVNPKLPASGWFVRKDWLDKLGLEVPKTVDEFHDMLVAFRDRDPNGNGIKDEVPYFNRFDGIGHLLLLFDTITNWEIVDDDIVYGPTTPQFKEAYKNIAQWYKEGLIDKEIYTRGSKSRDKLLGDNVGGATHDYFGTTAQYNDMLKDTVPGINFVPIAPPNNKEYTQRDLVAMRGIAISAKSKKKEVAMRFLDYMFSEDGTLITNFGIEGEHYEMKDEYPTYKDWVLHGDKTTVDILSEAGAASAFPHKFDFRYEEQWLTPLAKEGMDMYQKYLTPQVPVLTYDDQDEERFNKIMTDVRTYVDEYTQKWVFGSASVDDTYDEFLAQMKKLGIDEATEIQRKAYKNYREMVK